MPWPFDKKPTEEDLARWRREFEAARSFEDADDEKYAFRPLEQPTAQNASRVISRNPFSRIAAAQKWEEPARAVVPPRQPKHSMPQYYVRTHVWRTGGILLTTCRTRQRTTSRRSPCLRRTTSRRAPRRTTRTTISRATARESMASLCPSNPGVVRSPRATTSSGRRALVATSREATEARLSIRGRYRARYRKQAR